MLVIIRIIDRRQEIETCQFEGILVVGDLVIVLQVTCRYFLQVVDRLLYRSQGCSCIRICIGILSVSDM